MDTTWEHIKDLLRKEIPKSSYALWIEPMSLLQATGGSVTLACPNRFSLQWVTEHYLELIRTKFSQKTSTPVELILKVGPPLSDSSPDSLPLEEVQLPLPSFPSMGRRGQLRLNGNFTFDRFVVGASNQFAYSASAALADADLGRYDTLFLLSSTGLGKTHLSQAVGNRILQRMPGTRVYYITAEDFANEMIRSLKNRRIEEFKDKYRRGCDVLLLEEVHFLSGKEKIQKELGYTLDALVSDKKKIIFTSSMPPKDIPGISRELSSRFASGLLTAITTPEYDTRLRILGAKAEELDLQLREEVLEFLASELKRDVRQMESALKCLKARSDLMNVPIDMDLARDVLSCFVSAEKALTLDRILNLVCRYYKVEPEILRSRSRKRIHVYPRNVFVYLSRRHTDKTLDAIGGVINRTHSTVLYAAEMIEKRSKTDRKLRSQVEFLSRKLAEMPP